MGNGELLRNVGAVQSTLTDRGQQACMLSAGGVSRQAYKCCGVERWCAS